MFQEILGKFKTKDAGVRDYLKEGSLFSALSREGVVLPREYEAFLLEFPQGLVFEEEVGVRGITSSPWAVEGIESISVFLGCDSSGINDLIKVRHVFADELPSEYLVIGFPSSGENAPICLRVELEQAGGIYVWNRTSPKGSDSEEEFYLISNDFSSLLSSLTRRPSRNSFPGQKPRLVSKYISPELDAKIRAHLASKASSK